jgi:hypothetical protein
LNNEEAQELEGLITEFENAFVMKNDNCRQSDRVYQEYCFTSETCQGQKHNNTDALSRRPW